MDEFGVRDQIEKPIRTIQTHARQNILNHTIYQFLLNYIYFRLNIEDIFFPALYMMMMRDGPRYGFWVRCRRGWQVTKLGIKVVRADPELMVYMFFSALFSIGAFVVLMTSTGGLGYFIGGGEEGFTQGAYVGSFLSYMAVAIITVFWNAAIIASAYHRLTTGENPSFSYGIRQAMKCLPQIFIWGLISGTVGLIIQALEGMKQSDNPVSYTHLRAHET